MRVEEVGVARAAIVQVSIFGLHYEPAAVVESKVKPTQVASLALQIDAHNSKVAAADYRVGVPEVVQSNPAIVS